MGQESLAQQQAKHESENLVESKIVYNGSKTSVRVDSLRAENGDIYKREIVLHRGAIVVIPVDDDGKIILVRQWRRATGKVLLELPAGTLEDGEPADEAAQRELQEEIGYRTDKLTPLGGFFSAPGFCSEYLYLFLAENLQESRLDPDAHEVIEVYRYTLDEALDLIEKGEIEDAKSVAGLCRYYARQTRKS